MIALLGCMEIAPELAFLSLQGATCSPDAPHASRQTRVPLTEVSTSLILGISYTFRSKFLCGALVAAAISESTNPSPLESRTVSPRSTCDTPYQINAPLSPLVVVPHHPHPHFCPPQIHGTLPRPLITTTITLDGG